MRYRSTFLFCDYSLNLAGTDKGYLDIFSETSRGLLPNPLVFLVIWWVNFVELHLVQPFCGLLIVGTCGAFDFSCNANHPMKCAEGVFSLGFWWEVEASPPERYKSTSLPTFWWHCDTNGCALSVSKYGFCLACTSKSLQVCSCTGCSIEDICAPVWELWVLTLWLRSFSSRLKAVFCHISGLEGAWAGIRPARS